MVEFGAHAELLGAAESTRSCTACSSVRDGWRLSARLQSLWYRPTPPPLALRPLARCSAWRCGVRRAAYARGCCAAPRLARPVIVVGNLTVGGSGKTPLVIWLVQQLRARRIRARRGAARLRRQRRPTAAAAAWSSPTATRPRSAMRRCCCGGAPAAPVAVGRDRVRPRSCCSQHGADVIIADDGLQHLALARDFELGGGRRRSRLRQRLPAARRSAARAGRSGWPAWMRWSSTATATAGARPASAADAGSASYDAARGRAPAAPSMAARRSCRSRVSPAGGCTPWPVSAIRGASLRSLRAAGLEVVRACVSRPPSLPRRRAGFR